jgi:type IV secretion system protein TrbL
MTTAVDVGVIDTFTNAFTTYIDSGFGLLKGEVAYLASTLIVLDITLAGVFWTLAVEEDVLARLIKKTLYVGFFAFLISNFSSLATIVYNSFAQIGLQATGSTVSASQFNQPSTIAWAGITAGRPILAAAGQLVFWYPTSLVSAAVLVIAWLIVVVSMFIIAVQVFVTMIEFKVTTLVGFVLVPFGLFGKTAFLAERVLGNVVATGVKVLVLAVVIGIGTTLFNNQFGIAAGAGPAPAAPPTATFESALAVALAALALLGISIYAPSIATGLASGAPQLGAGAAVGTAATVWVSAKMAGAVTAGAASLGPAAAAALRNMRPQPPPPTPPPAGGAGGQAGGGGGGQTGGGGGAPAWARRMRRAGGIGSVANALKSGSHGGSGYSVDLPESE